MISEISIIRMEVQIEIVFMRIIQVRNGLIFLHSYFIAMTPCKLATTSNSKETPRIDLFVFAKAPKPRTIIVSVRQISV